MAPTRRIPGAVIPRSTTETLRVCRFCAKLVCKDALHCCAHVNDYLVGEELMSL